MDSIALIESFGIFKEEKNIDRITLMAIIEEALTNVLKKKFGSEENFDIIVNPDKGDLEIWHNRLVVEDGAVENPYAEIALSDAQKIEPDFEVGEEVSEEIKIESLGRRAILSLRQILIGKIMDHDNVNLYEKFQDMVGEVITAEVHHVRHNQLIAMDDDQNELILPKVFQIKGDFYRKGDSIKAVVEEVKFKGNKPQIIISRTSGTFLEKLFEQEIPEVFDGLITIKKTARIPGEKAKVSVESYDDRIDPVGACVGMRGSRIFSIVKELRNENIDVINYTNNIHLYITRALAPAKITRLELDESNHHARVFLKPDEVSRAIGRGGQNIKLASLITGYEIDVFRDTPFEEDVEITEFTDEIEPWIIQEFKKVGLDTAKSILELELDDLINRTDLEEETVIEVIRILKEEFED